MRPLVWGILLLIALVIQATLVPMIAIDGIRPDLLLVLVVSSALLLGQKQGIGLGFFSGLLQDLASGNIFGLNLLTKTITGYVAGSLERKVFKENVFLPVIAVGLATAFNNALMLVFLFVFGYELQLMPALVNIAYGMVYNAIVAIPLHQVVYRVARQEIADQSEG